jgi:putative transposase
VHDDLVDRNITAVAPNRLWLTDITEHRTNAGKLYLCAIKDVYSNRIVRYSVDAFDGGVPGGYHPAQRDAPPRSSHRLCAHSDRDS